MTGCPGRKSRDYRIPEDREGQVSVFKELSLVGEWGRRRKHRPGGSLRWGARSLRGLLRIWRRLHLPWSKEEQWKVLETGMAASIYTLEHHSGQCGEWVRESATTCLCVSGRDDGSGEDAGGDGKKEIGCIWVTLRRATLHSFQLPKQHKRRL